MGRVIKALLITLKHFGMLIFFLATLILVVFGTALILVPIANISPPLALLCGLLVFVFLVMFVTNLAGN